MATTVKVASQAKWEPGMQESDLMDALPNGKSRMDAQTQSIMLVSLGCYCGPKLSFKNIGRGAETLPFDWMRTRHEGLMHFLQGNWDEESNYNGFFEFTSKKVVPGCQMTTYRSYYHSFWHDDPTDPGMHERYKRRIKRFNEIDAESKPVLFVRTIPTTEELENVPALMDLLIKRHGKQAFLLLIIDFQKTAQGAAVVEGIDNIMVHFLSGSKHVNQEGLPAPPYGDAVNLALDWIVGRSVSVMQFENWESIMRCSDHTEWGLNGLGGLYAFELGLEAPQEEPPELSHPLPQLDPIPSEKLEDMFLRKAPRERPQLRQLQVVPLGFGGFVKASVLAMGIPSVSLPFDWIMISHAGLLHFLRQGFEAPIRNGLGAGGQRPAEKRGFFDFATRRPVQGSEIMMSRSHLHSFWHDDPADPEVRQAFETRFENFENLAKTGDTLLFVRVVATTAELGRAYELTQALSKKFGPQAALLLICDFQSKVGPVMVDAFDDLMVYFLEADAHKDVAPYRKPILSALEWLSGKELRMDIVPDFKALQALASPNYWGLMGYGGFLALEGLTGPPAEMVEWTPAPEDQWLMDAKFEADKDAMAVVSLGYHEFLGKALELAKLPVETSPFDGAFINGEGVLNFLRNDFTGYLDVAKPLRIEGSPYMVRRSCYHSFWDIDPNARLRQAEMNIRSFRHLLGSNRVKLFVRAVARGDELPLLGEIHEALCKHSQSALLLAIVGGQEKKTLTVASNYSVLVQFIEEDPIQTGVLQSYAEPVRSSLDWAVGKELKVGVVPDFAALKGLLRPLPPTPLVGPGNVPLFEENLSTTDESGEGSLSSSSSPGVHLVASNLKVKVPSPSRGYAGFR
ncbi:unnamed protein product [Durusdinium trenchii]|uniref:Uncharacterized protein n=2 Tax=Durusdinium trenchii TaxID=1381693 RepID=A0ABP0LFB4_9DINO